MFYRYPEYVNGQNNSRWWTYVMVKTPLIEKNFFNSKAINHSWNLKLVSTVDTAKKWS